MDQPTATPAATSAANVEPARRASRTRACLRVIAATTCLAVDAALSREVARDGRRTDRA